MPAVVIVCPYCTHRLNLKAAKSGRFRPNCPGCAKPFVLIVPENPAEAAEARPLPVDTVANAAPDAAHKPVSAAQIEVTAVSLPDFQPPETDSHAAAPATHPAPIRPGTARPTNAAPKRPTPPPVEVSPSAVLPASGKESPDAVIPPKTVVRGYRLERELGRGGMGSVYLAKQLSLDRHVALKVMSKKWASDPVFVARFTREAYAAAQLSHPNIVQIHDIGEANGTRFFSMEYVRGRSLADIIRAQGKLDPETAVGYILQAARGLKHAHDRGMIHRDVKPDNLLLGEQGLLKVADLGLVKTPTVTAADDRLADKDTSGSRAEPAEMTGAKIALGTPAYMSPEQCRDAATVDHRADIYSLGCTFYVLVTGRPPFDGTTAMELMTRHAYDPLVPPEQIVARVPKEVSAVIQKMMEKNADHRFQTMDEVIRTLETWLGVHHAGTFSPREEQIAQLENAVLQFNTAPRAVLRSRLLTGFLAVVGISALLLAFFGRVQWAVGLVGLVVQGGLAYFVIDGVANRSFLFSRMRHFVSGLSWGDWLVGIASFALSCVLLALLGLFWIWLGFGVAGVALAFALRYGLDRKVEQQRRGPIDVSERLLRRLRMQGLDEEEVRQFVAKFAGRDWEEFFETLFGYEAKLAARVVLFRGGSAGIREKHAAWREPLIALMDRIEKARRAAREQRLLREIERANLVATGEKPEDAEDKAKAAAEAMVKAADRVREAEEERAKVVQTAVAPAPPVNVRLAVAAAEENPFIPPPPPRRDPGVLAVSLLVGPHVRAVLGAILLAGCALWVHQNGLLPGMETPTEAVESGDLNALQQSATANLKKPTKPLEIAGVPAIATSWIDSWNAGVAGVLLLASLFYRGNVMALFVLLGSAIVAFGHQFGISTVEPFRPEHVSLLLGSVLALVGLRMGR